MNGQSKFVAIDLGASNGRMMVGLWNGKTLTLEELHRFDNGGVPVGTSLYWDAQGIWSHVQDGLRKYRSLFHDSPDAVSVDAWGVDFGLLDKEGCLLGNPMHYRDSRTHGIAKSLFDRIPESQVFTETAAQTMEINTLFQLFSMVQAKDPHLETAETLLMIPDLFNYFLCGERRVEYTEATTTQMYSPKAGGWAKSMLDRIGIPTHFLPEVISSGKILGCVRQEMLKEHGFTKPISVIATASHDTASAVAAIPGMDSASVFISSGTWSLIGVEVDKPDISAEALKMRFTNEGGPDGKFLLIKNVTGLWILQECLHHWNSHRVECSLREIVRAASEATPLQCIFDPNHESFQAGGDMPLAIQSYCRATGQKVPSTAGEIARCALESLSLKYRSVVEALESLTGRNLQTIRVVGGGSLNTVLSQMTADACNRRVVAGPVEASALGNVMLQAIAMGHVQDIAGGRLAINESVRCISYVPHPSAAWDEAYARFKMLEIY